MKRKDKEYPTPMAKADSLYDIWGLLGAQTEAFEGITFNLPPGKEYWEEVKRHLKFFHK